ncbi:MAG TPA: POTRA domain-containing protein [Candidatus Eremiobacteraceae bacterium]|nr:POTRA domain-containing protein [Candidatus Eremiobacteraceae bacterium]
MVLFLRSAAVAMVVVAVALTADPRMSPAALAPIVTAINVRGNAHVPADRILAVVRTQVGAPLDTKELANDESAILALGFFTDVKTDVRATPGGVSVNFIVIENPVVTKILFTGNEHVTADILGALMDTTTGAVLNTDTLRDDVQKINSYYDKLGYTGTRHVQNIKIDPDGTLHLDIKEGVTVTSVVVTGNTIIPTPAVLGAMKTRPGVTYSDQTFQDDLEAINKLYKDLGFSAAVDGGADPNNPGVVNVTICEYRVGAVEIQGNSKTKDYVIRRLLRLRPGDLISDNRLRYDYEQINNTQYFKSVDASFKPFGTKCGYVTVVWTVVEQRTGTANFGVSYSGGGVYGQGLAANISFAENNLNGTGNGASIGFERGQYISDVNLGVTVPYIHEFKPDSMTFSIFNNNVHGQPYPVYKEAGNNPYYTVSPTNGVVGVPFIGVTPAPSGPCTAGTTPCGGLSAGYSSRQAGFSLGFGHPIAYYTRISYGVSISRLYQSFTANGFSQDLLDLRSALISPNNFGENVGGAPVNQGSSNLHTVNFGIVRDNRDDVQNPRYGGTSSLAEELALRPLGSDYRYSKSDMDLTRFWPVRHHSTLAAHLNVGVSSGGSTLPYSELFSLSDQQLRGQKYVFYGDRELLGQLELRVPVTPDKKFAVAFFSDAGDTPYVTPLVGPTPLPTPTPPAGPHAPFFPPPQAPVTYKEAPFHIYTDFGFGIRVETPILPGQALRLDFATGASGAHVSFGIGQSF